MNSQQQIESGDSDARHGVHPVWHLLQISDVLDLEFATALAELVPLLAWEPKRTVASLFLQPGKEGERTAPASALRIRELPLLRGFSRLPFSLATRVGPTITDRLLHQTTSATFSPLLCTIPHFAPVAEQWPGPVVYWLTDLIAEYAGANRAQVVQLDRRMCNAATLICPNSERLADYLVNSAGCDPGRIQIVPNATRESNLLPGPPPPDAGHHPDFASIPRPIAGVIGNLSGNMDWLLIQRSLDLAPSFSWVFVGPTSMQIAEREQRRARERVMHHPRAHFLGSRPYGSLASYARAFDVAVIPYKRCEPTYSGSSTRFYEHLAACRPIVATRGLEELTRKPPLLTLVDSAEQVAHALNALAAKNFDDGLSELRWRHSHRGTWQTRARTLHTALFERLAPVSRRSA